MKFPKYTNYSLILFLVALSFILRYPRTPHSVGIDAFVMQGLTNSIVTEGFAAWVIHPLSYIGLYPLSYPSGGIFLPAGLVIFSGQSSEVSILALSFLMGLIGVLGAYILAKEFRDDHLFAFLVAFIFCLAPKFILNTTWETPTRGGFMAFTPIFLWALLRAHRDPSRKNIIMTVLMLFILSTFHRLAILMLIVILAYIITFIFRMVVRIAKLKTPTLFLRPRARQRMRVFGVVAMFGIGTALILGSGVLDAYESGRLVSSPTLDVELVNLGVSLTRSSGVLTVFLVFGMVTLAYKRNKTIKESLFLFVVLAIIPTLYLRRYTGFYIPVFVALLAGSGVVSIVLASKNRKKVSIALFVTIMLGSLVLTSVLLDYESESTNYMEMEEYNTGLYSREYLHGTLLTNDGLSASRTSAVSGLPYLPIGGATVPRNGPEQLAFGFVLPEDVHVVQVPIDQLTLNDDSPFVAQDVPNAQADYWILHAGIIGDPQHDTANAMLDQYGIDYALENKGLYGEFYAYARDYYSRFLTNIHWQRYKIYESSEELVWSL
jgi:hypothetical protein